MKQMGFKISKLAGVLLAAVFATGNDAHALEYVSVADKSAILYDAPSTKGKKLFVISRFTPLEKVVNLEYWIKVRDKSGGMAWIERRAVSDKHYVVVSVPLATVRQAPEANAPVVFQVSQNVVMEALGINGGGWIKARHQDGSSGFMKSVEVWGAD
jgi:SH3-like domain-containing protein